MTILWLNIVVLTKSVVNNLAFSIYHKRRHLVRDVLAKKVSDILAENIHIHTNILFTLNTTLILFVFDPFFLISKFRNLKNATQLRVTNIFLHIEGNPCAYFLFPYLVKLNKNHYYKKDMK